VYGKDKHDLELFEARLEKTSIATYKIIFYSFMSLWAYNLLKDTLIWPGFMGGIGSVENSYKTFPYAPQIPGLLTYSLVSLGYYLDDLVNHNFFRPKSNDYWEMNLHHLVTIGLFGGMIPMNAIRPGAIISLLHGLSDITIAASRIGSHTEFKLATRVIFISQTGIFIYLRNFAIPAYTIGCWQLLKYPSNLSHY
jgi:TLC domain